MKYRKRTKVPKHSAKQIEDIPKKCRLLRRKFLKKETVLVMDDEKYFTFSCLNLTGKSGFYTKNIRDTPADIKFMRKTKFEPKILVWAAISEKGVSELFIETSKGFALKKETYIKQCLTRLKKFLQKYHAGDRILFWPDLASCHYARETLDWLKNNKIEFVPRDANPPNLPAARPIENFWALLAREVYKNGWEAKTKQQLVNRIIYCSKKVSVETVQKMMRSVRTKLRAIEDMGPDALY